MCKLPIHFFLFERKDVKSCGFSDSIILIVTDSNTLFKKPNIGNRSTKFYFPALSAIGYTDFEIDRSSDRKFSPIAITTFDSLKFVQSIEIITANLDYLVFFLVLVEQG